MPLKEKQGPCHLVCHIILNNDDNWLGYWFMYLLCYTFFRYFHSELLRLLYLKKDSRPNAVWCWQQPHTSCVCCFSGLVKWPACSSYIFVNTLDDAHPMKRVCVLVRLPSMAMLKHHDQKPLGEKGVYLACKLQSNMEETKAEIRRETWREELKHQPCGNTAYWLACLTCSACFLAPPRTTCLEVALLAMGRPLPSHINH